MAELTQEELKKILRYEPETGLFYWIESKQGRQLNRPAGTLNRKGYIRFRINSKHYQCRRLVWMFIYGEPPKYQIDHRNGIRSDNRIENLREATSAENSQNRTIRSDNASGYIGVFRKKRYKKWGAQIKINKKTKFLGYFDTPEQAHKTYLAAKSELHRFQPVPRIYERC